MDLKQAAAVIAKRFSALARSFGLEIAEVPQPGATKTVNEKITDFAVAYANELHLYFNFSDQNNEPIWYGFDESPLDSGGRECLLLFAYYLDGTQAAPGIVYFKDGAFFLSATHQPIKILTWRYMPKVMKDTELYEKLLKGMEHYKPKAKTQKLKLIK